MNTEQMIDELDNLLDKLSDGVDLGDTKAISEYHKILKSKAELLGLNPLTSERMRIQAEIEVQRFLKNFVGQIEKDDILPNSSKIRVGEIAENLLKQIELERQLSLSTEKLL